VFVSDFNVDNVRAFRASWPNKNFAARKKLEATRAFFRFCNVSGWISTNPASVLKPNKTTDPEIVPVTKNEFDKILKACADYPDVKNAVRLRAIVLLMRYSGLRIRDVVTLKKDRIQKGEKPGESRLFPRTAKSGTKVSALCRQSSQRPCRQSTRTESIISGQGHPSRSQPSVIINVRYRHSSS
jgi:integrase